MTWSVKLNQLGMPTADKLGVGDPVAVTVNDPAEPMLKLVMLLLVIAGALCAAPLTTSVKLCVADPCVLVAVMVSG